MPEPSSWILHRTGVTGGTYRGLLTATDESDETPPPLTLVLGGETLGEMTMEAVDGGWQVEGEMGLAPLTDGAQTVFVRLPDGTALDSVTVITGLSAPEDLRAELATLRDEVTLLKKAFRRHVNQI
ncbi:hypothetical protein SAMN05444004_101190 [Jannaschia faecimaris]|uniref:Uncharacterized protein n=1 Tax=Jannaschia faecimaris TaxID=1244108 RepID=A0A1H3J2W1_9RHOB|nr:hypothetical protein [Jannaschia faecimaris]SDY34271.1 hypothetical protein SAMN05444004_101190 [Jannaschia faecimaris]